MALLSRGGGNDVAESEALGTAAGSRLLASGPPRVNLLPPELLEARRVRVIQIGGAVAVAGAAVVVAGLWYTAHSGLSDAKKAHATAETRHARLQADVARYGDVDALYRKVDAAEAMVSTATATEVHWSTYLDDLSIALPDHIWLTNLSLQTGGAQGSGATAAATTLGAAPAASAPIGSVGLSGSGYVHNDVANLLDRISHIKGFINVYLTNTTESLTGTGANAVPTVNWTATAGLSSDALAHPNGGGDR